MTLLGDDLYNRQPLCQTARKHGYGFIFLCLPSSHEELYEWLEDLERAGDIHSYEVSCCQNSQPFHDQFRDVNRVPWRAQQPALEVNWCEVTVTHTRKDKQVYFNTFVTERVISDENVASIVEAGLPLEHNFGHGQEHLSELLVTLNITGIFDAHDFRAGGGWLSATAVTLGHPKRFIS